MKDLNPIVEVKPEFRASVQHGATQLFQTYEKDMNGRHHAVIRLSNVNGKTKTEHVRQLLEQGEYGSTPRAAGSRSDLVSEPYPAEPYPADQGEDAEAGGAGAEETTTYEQGEEDMSGPRPMQGEPGDCPYPLPSVEGDDNGKSYKTSTSDGGDLEEYDEDASLGMGHEHPAEKVKVRDLISPVCHASQRRDHTNMQCVR